MESDKLRDAARLAGAECTPRNRYKFNAIICLPSRHWASESRIDMPEFVAEPAIQSSKNKTAANGRSRCGYFARASPALLGLIRLESAEALRP
ncbi:MAG: hypothetical protein CME55_02305 [Halieaceae bacterium]|nr:hypothetical protein [Halieaceae bacterium]